MQLEFAAGKGRWKRHLMEQLDDNKFRLLARDDAAYKIEWWTEGSVLHNNIKTIGMTRIDATGFFPPRDKFNKLQLQELLATPE